MEKIKDEMESVAGNGKIVVAGDFLGILWLEKIPGQVPDRNFRRIEIKIEKFWRISSWRKILWSYRLGKIRGQVRERNFRRMVIKNGNYGEFGGEYLKNAGAFVCRNFF